MSTTADQRIGILLQDRYRLIAELGRGASAHVYLADDDRLQRPVAVKVLHQGLSGDPAFRRRLLSEAHSAATLNHPNIVHVYDWGDDQEGLFLVLEYLDGGSLRDLLDVRGALSVAQAASIGSSIGNALAFAHQRGLIHRDVKPANLLFDEHGSVHLADFGLAKALADASWTEPEGVVVGTARYASPEQALGQRVDGRSDVYSLALVLFESVTGRVPFVGDTAYATLVARIGSELPSAPELGLLAPCLEAATHPDRNRRLDAAEFASALRRVVNLFPDEHAAPLRASGTLVPARRVPEADEETTRIGRSGRPEANLKGRNHRVESDGTSEWIGTVEGPEEPGGIDRPNKPRVGGRRWGRRVVAALAVLVLAAGTVVAVARYVVFDHVVPSILHVNLAAAEKDLVRNGLGLRVDRRIYSSAVQSGDIVSQIPTAGHRERSGTVVSVVVSEGPALTRIPNVVGAPKVSAVATLAHAHLVAVVATTFNETVPAGHVAGISPTGGRVHFGAKVTLSVSLGPHPRAIPQFASTNYGVARGKLEALRLVPIEHLAYSNGVVKGVVISTSPAEGTTGVRVGSSVEVIVSRGPRLVTVPTVTNEPVAEAVRTLQRAGLTVNEQIGPPFATKATTTNPAPGVAVAIGTAVTLYVA